jgi:hypothetical protein
MSAKLKKCALYCTRDPKKPDKTKVDVKEAKWGIVHEIVIWDPSRRYEDRSPRCIPTGILIVLPLCQMHTKRMQDPDYWPGQTLVPFDLKTEQAKIAEVAKTWRVSMSNSIFMPLIDGATRGLYTDPLNSEGVTHD